MKIVIRVILLFCLLTIGRISYMYAYVSGTSNVCTFSPLHSSQNENGKLKAVEIGEEQDDDQTSAKKKYITPGFQITTYHYAHPGFTRYSNSKAPPAGRNSYYRSTPRNILFGVFRI
ncbi:MAG: hypothetical protein EOP56_17320 [Sphingobacteriales bacterium]|nr:MAG: hypothetical protein EOP56_17320 [Sphingobacteriales bacterium]